MSKKTLYAVVIPAVVAIFVGAFAIGTDMFDYYCSAGSVFLGIDMSVFLYCKPVVYIVHVVIASLIVISVLNLFLSKSKEKDVSVANYKQSPHTEGDLIGDIVYGDKIEGKKKDRVKREANFRLEPRRSDVDTIVVTVFNDEDVDFTEKSAELLGFGKLQPDGTLLNMIDILGHERRGLVWFEKENKIVSGGHSLIEVTAVDWQGIHFNSMTVEHNTDEAIWKVGIEIRGKLDDYPIIPKSCCLTFVVRKNILNNNKEIWVVGQPKLSNGDCDWAKTISGKELEKYFEKKQEKKWWMS